MPFFTAGILLCAVRDAQCKTSELRSYLGIETVYCRLLQWIARMDEKEYFMVSAPSTGAFCVSLKALSNEN